MTEHPQDPELDKKPQNQADENSGSIKSRQVTDRNSSEKDLARRSETEARRKGNN